MQTFYFVIAEILYLQFFMRSLPIISMHPKWLVFSGLFNETEVELNKFINCEKA